MNSNVDMMSYFTDTDELEIFDTDVIHDIIEYKWKVYGMAHHMMGLTMHFVYTFTLIIYVNEVYLRENTNLWVYTIMLCLGVIYPMWYESKQLTRIGWSKYLQDANNYTDFFYIWGSIANLFL